MPCLSDTCRWPSGAWASWCLLGLPSSFLVVSSLHCRGRTFGVLPLLPLVQTAGIFNVLLTQKLSYIVRFFGAIIDVGYTITSRKSRQFKFDNFNILILVQQVVFCILLCPLAAVYVFGLLISAGISVWRLSQRDYGSNASELGNLKPSLVVLYSLALLQGVIFCLKPIFDLDKRNGVDFMIKEEEFGDQFRAPLSDYLNKTVTGCEKDISFASGRNLITYAVDLMVSKSPDDYLSGVMILDAFTRRLQTMATEWEEKHLFYSPEPTSEYMQRHILMKYLIQSASSAGILQKLLQTLGHRSIYDRETREGAARLVASIAEDIFLEDFPRGIVHISCLIGTFEEYRVLQPYQRDWLYATYQQEWNNVARCMTSSDRDKEEDSNSDLLNTYKALVVQGFRILEKLATNNNNCRVMLDTPYLLSKILAPVTLDLLHHVDHGAWSSIVEGSLQVMIYLTCATGQTGTKLRSEISDNKEAISTMERILNCDKCNVKMRRQVTRILTELYRDTSITLETSSKEKFIEILIHIMTDDNNDAIIRAESAYALMLLSNQIEGSAMIIMKANDNVIDILATMILGRRKYKICAIRLLESLCVRYTDNDERLKRLQNTMTKAVPKLLGETFCWATEETHKRTTQVHHVSLPRPQSDEENQCGDSQDNGHGINFSSSDQQECKVDEFAVPWMLSLCVTICNKLITADQDLVYHFDAVAPTDGTFSFPLKLKEIVKRSMHPREGCLRILKLTCKMVISMMKHRGGYVKEELESLMDALTGASKEMFLLDGSIAFSVNHVTPKTFRSLASLVKDAQELVDKYNEH